MAVGDPVVGPDMVVSVAYRYQAVYVKFIGTHAEYDAVNAETVNLER